MHVALTQVVCDSEIRIAAQKAVEYLAEINLYKSENLKLPSAIEVESKIAAFFLLRKTNICFVKIVYEHEFRMLFLNMMEMDIVHTAERTGSYRNVFAWKV
jgi:hypothetical protein